MATETSLRTLIFVVLLVILAVAASSSLRVGIIDVTTDQSVRDRAVPLGLPPLPEPPADPQVVSLGEKLFFDRRLSFNGTMSCGMCHIKNQAFAANQLEIAVGMEGKSLRRNAPTILNVAYERTLFRDGREVSLETQVWSPLLAPDEMAAPSIGWALEKIRSLPDYRYPFDLAFPGRGVSMETVSLAIASYERSLLLANSRFDRWLYGGEKDALSIEERAGYELFVGKAGCAACHHIGATSALFSDGEFHDTGLGYAKTAGIGKDQFSIRLAEENFTVRTKAELEMISLPTPNDLGRFEITQNPKDRWAFKTPSLRNVALTSPYMHDGSIPDLEGVIEYYSVGGSYSPNKSELIRPMQLTDYDKRALVAFLKSLTGE